MGQPKKWLVGGIYFLEKTQLESGGFLSWSVSSTGCLDGSIERQTTFIPAIILSCLATLERSASIQKVGDKLVTFLKENKSSQGNWNYWTNDCAEYREQPYPDDLDDTACALIGLQRYDALLVGGQEMAHFTYTLTQLEVSIGGPYYTWLTNDTAWREVDLGVNANIAYLLSLYNIQLDSLEDLMGKAIDSGQYSSRYYPDEWVTLYYLARVYHGPSLPVLQNYLLQKTTEAHSVLVTALLLSATLNTGLDSECIKHLAQTIIKYQSLDGSWPAESFCIDPTIQGIKYHGGSSSLTTAFCLEALCLYEQHSKKEDPASTVCYEVTQEVRGRILCAPQPLQPSLIEAFESVLRINQKTPILTIAAQTRRALGVLADPVDIQLGAAAVFGWMAYTLYDKILDRNGKPALLPIATFCVRQMTVLFTGVLPEHAIYQNQITLLLNKMDAAHFWEQQNCYFLKESEYLSITAQQLPNYDLNVWAMADRSIGHALPSLAVFYSNGKDKEVKHLLAFFGHFLRARQLNDDAHDWQEDLERGLINSVVERLLRSELSISPIQEMSLSELYQRLSVQLWKGEIIELCLNIQSEVRAARHALESCSLVHPEFLLDLLKPIEEAASKVLVERNRTLIFIDTFSRVK